jgi:hypothetical protein
MSIKLYSLLELEYPLASKKDLLSYEGEEGWKGKIVWMSPDKFLSYVLPLHPLAMDTKSYTNLRNRMLAGLPLDFLVLAVDFDKRKIVGHEGRHRATVAKELGIKKVPVLIYTGHGFERVPKWTKDIHAVIDDLNFEPERKRLRESSDELVIFGAIDGWGDIRVIKSNKPDAKHPKEWERYKTWRFLPLNGVLAWWEPPDEIEREAVESWLEDKGFDIKLRSVFGRKIFESIDFKSNLQISEDIKDRAKKILYDYFKSKDAVNWLKHNEWTLNAINKKENWWIDGERYEFKYIPKIGKTIRKSNVNASSNRKYKFFNTPKSAIEYITALDNVKKFDLYVFRGMSFGEWLDANKKGYIKSNAKYNIGGVEYTYYGKEWDTAHSYASGFAPVGKTPTRSLPGVIVAVPKELVKPAPSFGTYSPKDEFVAEKIPISSISGVWYILPILVGEGILELVYKNGEIERGSAFPPTEKHIIVPKEGIALKQ